MGGLQSLNALSPQEAWAQFLRCCGSSRWAKMMAGRRPFRGEDEVYRAAEEIWRGLSREDRLEAFRQHPKIGDKESLRRKFALTRDWASGEQAGIAQADEEVLEGLAKGNRLYEERFGHIFIVCATGKSAAEMLAALRERLDNPPERELEIAAGEQAKITRLRLEKLLKA